jgi:hypothetical protein
VVERDGSRQLARPRREQAVEAEADDDGPERDRGVTRRRSSPTNRARQRIARSQSATARATPPARATVVRLDQRVPRSSSGTARRPASRTARTRPADAPWTTPRRTRQSEKR